MMSLSNILTKKMKTSNKRMDVVNIPILGKTGVGKTSVFEQLHRQFRSMYPETTHKTSNRLTFDNTKSVFLITDENVISQSKLSAKRSQVVTNGDAFILVFALDDQASFDYVETMTDYIKSKKGETVPILVIGNKNDVTHRIMEYPMADCIVSIEWDVKYLELSALNTDRFPQVLGLLMPNKNQSDQVPVVQDQNRLELNRAQLPVKHSNTHANGVLPKKKDTFPQNNNTVSGNQTPRFKTRLLELPRLFNWRRFYNRW